jgi:hypothetical protein
MSTLTSGQIEGSWDLITVTDTDRLYGYDTSYAFAQVSATSTMALFTMGMGCAAAQGSRIAGVAVSTFHTLEAVNAVTNIGNGIDNAIDNGLNLTNGAQIGMGLLTMTGLKATKCFTAETQVVIDNKLKDKVYFTETTESQSFDEVNILFTFAGLSSAFVATAVTLKKRNKPISRISSKAEAYLKKTSINDGLICEIDETEQSFSLRKWILLPLLIIVTIICGYFALPMSKTVAVSVPKIVIKDQLSTKDIKSIRCGDRVLGKNPVLSDEDRKLFGQEPTQETHYEYLFALPRDDETLTYITLLRPRDWLESFEGSESILEYETQTDTGESEDGICVWLDIPEMGAIGWAQLLSINDDFEIKSGNGNVVTGKFIHTSNNVIDLKIEGQDAPIGCTDNHPFWSVDRQDYINAGELREGEKVLLYSGETKRVEQKLPRPGPELVYNIEVFGEHVYHVTTDGILVHNAYHGNSLQSTKPNHVYVIRNKTTGEVHKYGISSGKILSNGKSLRAESQVKKLGKNFKSFILAKNLTRTKAIRKEQGQVNRFYISKGKLRAPFGNARPKPNL